MKRFLYIITACVVLVSGIAYASNPGASLQFCPFSASFNIDLSLSLFSTPITADYGLSGGYTEDRTMGIVGCEGCSSPTRVSVDSDFVLRSLSDPTLRRPFSIVLNPRMCTRSGAHTGYRLPEFNNTSHLAVGYGASAGITSFSLPRSDGGFEGAKAFWIDICLLLPDMSAISDPEIYNLGNAGDYCGKVTFVLQNGEKTETFDLYLRGYYQKKGSDNAEFQLVVVPCASSIDLKACEAKSVKVANVHFVSSSKNRGSVYSLRLSSSQNGGDGDFEFRREKTDGRPRSQYICAPYEASMKEDVSRSGNGTGTVLFSGKNDGTSVRLSMKSNQYKWGLYNQFEYYGEIYVQTKNAQQLIGGIYHSTIYIHVLQD